MKITVPHIVQMKRESKKICMMTCYDATFARLLDASGADILLVGDSLGMVIKGECDTLRVTVEEIAYHVRAVARGAEKAHVVADLPFLSYQTCDADAILNAGKLLQAGAAAVKLEGGITMAARVRRLVEVGIPVMGHVGLTPQSVHALGGFVVQGKTDLSKQRILDDAHALEDAGAYAVVLEGIDANLAGDITSKLRVPTIGIGAGPNCDGQVLVVYDLLGLDDRFCAKFVKRYLNGSDLIKEACTNFVDEVRESRFPTKEHSYYAKKPALPQVEQIV